MRHKYTAQELKSITRETPVYLEGAGIAQLQWSCWEIAEGVRDGYLFCKHIKPFAMELYDKYWTAWDGVPEGEDASSREDTHRNVQSRAMLQSDPTLRRKD